MASIFDDMPNTAKDPNALGSSGYSFYDADTLYDADGKGYRLQGVNALEVDRAGKEGQVGGDLTTEQAVRLANDLGYTNVVKTGEMDVTGKREIVDLQDAQGRSFRRQLAASGLTQGVPEYDPGGSLSHSASYRRALRTTDQYEENDFDKAAMALEDHIQAENADTLKFKQKRLLPGMNADFIADAGAVFEKDGIDTRTGEATSRLSTSWDTGMLGVAEGAYGAASLLGESLGIEPLEVWGEAGVRRKRAEMGDFGRVLTDYKDVEGFGDAVEYLSNNFVMSLPYLGMTALSALAAPLAIAPAAVYTGQAWNEMGDQIKATGNERSAGIAVMTGVAQATLDRLGLAGIVGKGAPKKMYQDAVNELAKTMPREAAEAAVAQASKRELASLAGDVGKIAREQVQAKHLVMDTAKRMGAGGVSEAVTEATQEAIAAIGADIGSGEDIDWLDVRDRATQGAIAGGAIGGTFSTAGAFIDAGQWANIAYNVDRENPADVADSTRYAREEENALGYVPTIQELTAQNRGKSEATVSLEERAKRHKEVQKKRTTSEVITDVLTSAPALWRGATRNIFSKSLQAKSRAARQLADMFGGNLQRIFGGANYESSKAHRQAIYKNMVSVPEKTWRALNGGKMPNRKQRKALSLKFYETARNAVDNEGNIDLNKLPDGPERQMYVKMINDLNALSNKMFDDQIKYNPSLGKLSNYLLKYKAIDPGAVKKNRSEFIDLLKSEYKLSESDARDIADRIMDGTQDLDEAFSVVKGGPVPKSHKRRSLGLSENKKFDKFVENDLYNNINQATKAATRYVAYQEFVGDNAKHISKLLQQMEQEGVSPEEVDKVAAQMQNYLDAESGNYKRPTSEVGRTLIAWQKNFMTLTTLAGLPLATFSSIVELALTQRALTTEQITRKNGGLANMGKELAQGLYDHMRRGVTDQDIEESRSKGRNILKNLGFYDWDVGAATTTGVSETHAWHQPIYEKYFSLIGLSQWTNYTRAVRASIAGDYIVDNIDVYLSQDPDAPRTNETREAEEKLRNIGIDVSRALPDLKALIRGEATPEQEAAVTDQLREAQFNFINDAVALPGAANRPLLYQDPRFAIFTQFQGFVSTFTANHIPKLWGEYISRGSPAMKYNTFAMMVTMVGLGFASQYLKDLLKHGGENPYLDDEEIIQRGIRASGLLGTSERIIDQFFPLYETRSKDAGEWLWNTTTGESPTLSNIKRVGSGVADTFSGDTSGAVKNFSKAGVGPLYDVGKNISEQLKAWNYDGG